jgi:aminoglycoside phosphotransferase (APT) family kinase protein
VVAHFEIEEAMARTVGLEGLQLIARGGQADIYAYGDRKVLRVGRREQDTDRIRYEYSVYSCLTGSGVAVPTVYELVQAGGMPAIVMDRIAGVSMMDQIKSNPFSAKAKARELADLHLQIGKVAAPRQITDAKAKAEFCIGKSENIDGHDKERILEVMKTLPDGTSLCHGDFHPGNILHHDGKNYVIDWSAASRGDFHADVAHSYLLMRVVPKVPHLNSMVHLMQKLIGRAIANTYLSTIANRWRIDYKILSRWILINAAERTYHGMTSEMRALKSFIGRYLIVLREGRDDEFAYQAL